MPKRQKDPYAPPPMHHDRSGVVLRLAIIAGLLGAAAWGYMTFGDQLQTAETPQEQQMADAGSYAAAPSTPAPIETAPQTTAPAATPAPAPRSTAPASPPAEAVPPPSTTSTPPPT